jgi:hypothetical protein
MSATHSLPADIEVHEHVAGLLKIRDANGAEWCVPLHADAYAYPPGNPLRTRSLRALPRPVHVTEVVVIEDAG